MDHSHHLWAVFYGLAGFMAGIAVAFFLIPLWYPTNTPVVTGWARRYRVAVVAGALFVITATMTYMFRGEPDAISDGNANTAAPASMQHNSVEPIANESGSTNSNSIETGAKVPGSLDQLATRLALRLRDGKGSDADWNLLRQSYEYLGDN